MEKPVYLDYAATTPVCPPVYKSMAPYFAEKYGNPSSIHVVGRQAKSAISKARKSVAETLNCLENEIYFTSGGTESNNLAILGRAQYLKANQEKGVFASSEIEHHAVLDAVKATGPMGMSTTTIRADENGIIQTEDVSRIFKKHKMVLVSVALANNEIGTIQPIQRISSVCKRNNVLLHVDACQAPMYLPLDVKRLGVDMMSLNGSKIYGPKGVGMLYIKKGVKVLPISYGGGQEQGLRSGTENVPGIVGFSFALERAQKAINRESIRTRKLRDLMIDSLLQIPGTFLNGDRDLRLPNNANISFLGVEGESLVLELDKRGICVSTGSACSSHALTPSHVIMAIYKSSKMPERFAHSSIRFTLGKYTKIEEIKYTILETTIAVNKLRKISSVW